MVGLTAHGGGPAAVIQGSLSGQLCEELELEPARLQLRGMCDGRSRAQSGTQKSDSWETCEGRRPSSVKGREWAGGSWGHLRPRKALAGGSPDTTDLDS